METAFSSLNKIDMVWCGKLVEELLVMFGARGSVDSLRESA